MTTDDVYHGGSARPRPAGRAVGDPTPTARFPREFIRSGRPT